MMPKTVLIFTCTLCDDYITEDGGYCRRLNINIKDPNKIPDNYPRREKS